MPTNTEGEAPDQLESEDKDEKTVNTNDEVQVDEQYVSIGEKKKPNIPKMVQSMKLS